MQEFSSISVSSYEAGTLADRLTEQSRDGWEVVAIVPTGSTVTAYLRRDEGAGEPAPEVTVAAAAATEPDVTPADQPTVATDDAATAAAGGAGWAAGGAAAAEPPAQPAAQPAAEPAAAQQQQAAVAPAGWYADPSSRFELRYWDGGQWTEHVSRGGQQYTDPPVA